MPNEKSPSSDQPQTQTWRAWAAIVAGFLVIALAVWRASAPRRAAFASATATALAPVPSATPMSSLEPLPTEWIVLPTATATPSPTPTPKGPTPTPSPTAEGELEIALVHSNDTWGYLLPCG